MNRSRGDERNCLCVCLSGGAPDARRQIRIVLEALGDPPVEVEESDAEDGTAAAPSKTHAVDVVMAVASEGEAGWLERLTRLPAAAPRAPLIAVAADRSPAAIRRILQAG